MIISTFSEFIEINVFILFYTILYYIYSVAESRSQPCMSKRLVQGNPLLRNPLSRTQM
jgi:hypothetical protein